MTVFGRDTAITSLQTLLLGPEIAIGALDALTELQAHEEDPSDRRRAREDRPRGARGPLRGDLVPALLRLDRLDAALPRPPRGDVALDGRRLARPPAARARAARARVDRPLRRPRRRRLRRVQPHGRRRPREPVVEGLGRLAALPRRPVRRARRSPPVEVQGYVYDAKRGLAELAREVWRDQALAERLEREADELRARFDEAFWVEERGGFYALALDGKKRKVDARCSNMGHLLWSGIVPPERVAKVVDQLLSEALWSGWGIRTMASDEAAFNPISYHNGTVWPHDTALAAWGLARHGYIGRGAPHRARADRGGGALRLVAARGLRRLRARRDAVPDRLSDGRAPAGVGGGHADPARPRPARDRAGPRAPAARHDGDGRASELARGSAGRGRSRFRSQLDGRVERGRVTIAEGV